LLATSRCRARFFIHTDLQIGDEGGKIFSEPFQRFAADAEEKRFKRLPHVAELFPNTQLKQGVNERSLAKSQLEATSS
jgi:hypothetical protein